MTIPSEKKRTRRRVFPALLLLFALLLSLASCFGEPEPPDPILAGKNTEPELRKDAKAPNYPKTVSVTLKAPAHCTVLSQNPVTVARGSSASFSVCLDENYRFDSSIDGLVYQNGTVILQTASQNREVTFRVVRSTGRYTFDYQCPAEADGVASCSVQPGVYTAGQEITVSVKNTENRVFVGWSVGASIPDGGAAVSYSPVYTFTLAEDTVLYPNYRTEGYTTIRYDLNGGVLASDGVTSVVETQFNSKIRLCPNLNADNGTFVRDGYTLIGYSQNKDGSGEFVTPGGIAAVSQRTTDATYYAQWIKWSNEADFTYELYDGGIAITGYRGNDKVLSIPAKIAGLPVLAVFSGAVAEKSFTDLVIPYTVTSMAPGAFVNCAHFDSLYITDSFTDIKDNAFQNCRAFSHLSLGASLAPVFANYPESITTRLEQIIQTDADKKIVLLMGGSSALYGFYSPLLEEGLGEDYRVINAGTNAAGLGLLYIEGLSHYMKAGDIVVDAAEYGNPQMGGTSFAWRVFRATEDCYNIYRYVDMTRYTGFFTAMTDFNTSTEARGGVKGTTYEKKNTTLTDPWCDYVSSASGKNEYNGAIFAPVAIGENSLSAKAAESYNLLNAKLKEKGIRFYLGAAPVYTFSEEYLQKNKGKTNTAEEAIEAYYLAAQRLLDLPVISDPAQYRFIETDYFNSAYHLTSSAAKVRTQKLLEDMKLQFERETLEQ